MKPKKCAGSDRNATMKLQIVMRCPNCGAQKKREGFLVCVQWCLNCGWCREDAECKVNGMSKNSDCECEPCPVCNTNGSIRQGWGDIDEECYGCGGDGYLVFCDYCRDLEDEENQRQFNSLGDREEE